LEKHYVLLFLSFLILAIPNYFYLIQSRGLSWDLTGAMAEADVYIREIFPGIYGWNSYFFMGYPFHIYPPLSRIVLGLLSLIFGLLMAAKLLIVISFFLTIIASYVFLRNFGFEKEKAAAICIILSVYMTCVSSVYHITTQNAHMSGMLGNFFAFPFLIFSLAFFEKNKKLSIIFSSIVLLSNILIAIALLLSIFILFICGLEKTKVIPKIKEFLSFLLILFLINAFWIIPFLVHLFSSYGPKFSYFNGYLDIVTYAAFIFSLTSILLYIIFVKKIIPKYEIDIIGFFCIFFIIEFFSYFTFSEKSTAIIFAILTAISLLSLFYQKNWKFLKFYLSFNFIITLLILVIYFVFGIFSSTLLTSLVHVYRINFFFNFFKAIIIGSAIFEIFKKYVREYLSALATLSLTLVVLFYFVHFDNLEYYIHYDEIGYEFDFKNIETIGRTIVGNIYVGSIGPHSSYFLFYLQNKKPILNGLYVEEAQSSFITVPFNSVISKFPFYHMGNVDYLNRSKLNNHSIEKIKFYADLLWTTDLIVCKYCNEQATKELEKNFQKIKEIETNSVKFTHYRIGNFSAIEIRNMSFLCSDKWNDEIKDWFENGKTEIFLDSCENQTFEIPKNAHIERTNFSNGKISFFVNSSKPVPVLIKESYDKNWQAYADGKETKIYRTITNQMAIISNGNIKLEYSEKYTWAYFGLFIIGILLLVMLKI
jgi:hypothetical protein